MTFAELDLLVTIDDLGLALEDANLILIGREIVNAGLHQAGGRIVFEHLDVVLLEELVNFDLGAALYDGNLGISEVGRDHLDGAIVIQTQEHAGREQNFSSAIGRRGDGLSGFEIGRPHGLGSDRLILNGGLTLNEIQGSW